MNMSKKEISCPFCKPSREIQLESPSAFAIFDRFPVSKGHMLIIPKVHVSDYFDLDAETKNSLTELLDQAKIFIDEKYSPDGYNIGINAGRAAGQTVWHVHVHLMPRYSGDTENPRGGVRGVIPDKQQYRLSSRKRSTEAEDGHGADPRTSDRGPSEPLH